MKFGIVGLPLVGKSTIFNMLTHGHAQTDAWGGHEEAHVGVARIPDPRLDRLAAIFRSKKATPPIEEFVDIPGIARRGKEAAFETEPRSWPSYLNSLKNAEALVHVVRAFQDPSIPHSEGGIDPPRDVALFELEMIFADLAIIEKRLERLARDMKKIKSAELEAEHELLQRFGAVLEAEQPLRDVELSEAEQRLVRGFTFLSSKPMLFLLNLAEADAARLYQAAEDFGLSGYCGRKHMAVAAVCGKIEAEIAALAEEDAKMFMEDLGLRESGLARVAAACHFLMGLVSFYTVSENETRCWSIPENTPAVKAAGAVHTDFERGFIKAEVVSYSDMLAAGSFQAARSKGLLRVEGKDYPVRDADVILFRFNV